MLIEVNRLATVAWSLRTPSRFLDEGAGLRATALQIYSETAEHPQDCAGRLLVGANILPHRWCRMDLVRMSVRAVCSQTHISDHVLLQVHIPEQTEDDKECNKRD